MKTNEFVFLLKSQTALPLQIVPEYMYVYMYVSVAAGLASPATLQNPVPSKPKNGSIAISKPQDGQLHFISVFPC